MKLNKIILILGITIAIFIGITLGASYAWYAYNNAETRVTGTTTKQAATTIFSQTEYLFFRNIMPILDEDRYNYGNKNSFTVTIGEDLKNYEVGIEVSLKDVIMSKELRIPNYKYELLQDGIVVGSGNFSNIGTSSTMTLMPMTKLVNTTLPKTYTFELYIWLSDDGTDQNDLMDKAFSAKVNVNSATKKVERR